jgi:hypothetical protein
MQVQAIKPLLGERLSQGMNTLKRRCSRKLHPRETSLHRMPHHVVPDQHAAWNFLLAFPDTRSRVRGRDRNKVRGSKVNSRIAANAGCGEKEAQQSGSQESDRNLPSKTVNFSRAELPHRCPAAERCAGRSRGKRRRRSAASQGGNSVDLSARRLFTRDRLVRYSTAMNVTRAA